VNTVENCDVNRRSGKSVGHASLAIETEMGTAPESESARVYS